MKLYLNTCNYMRPTFSRFWMEILGQQLSSGPFRSSQSCLKYWRSIFHQTHKETLLQIGCWPFLGVDWHPWCCIQNGGNCCLPKFWERNVPVFIDYGPVGYGCHRHENICWTRNGRKCNISMWFFDNYKGQQLDGSSEYKTWWILQSIHGICSNFLGEPCNCQHLRLPNHIYSINQKEDMAKWINF